MVEEFDVIVRGASIVGGSGRKAFVGSMGVRGEKVAAMVREQGAPIESLGIAGQTPSVGRWKALVDSYR